MKPVDPSRVRDRAYARWQQRGCPQGSAEQDWVQAEQELAEQAEGDGAEAAIPAQPTSIAPPSAPASERIKPPRPTLKRSPGARAAKLLNEVSPRAPIPRTQVALAVAAAAYIKRCAAGSG
jgi:hypothetical protein